MRIEAKSHGNVTIVSLSGEFDAVDARQLGQRLKEAIGSDVQNLVLNVREIRFMDLSNLGLVVGIARRVRERNGSLVLSEPSGRLRATIETLGLDRVLRSFDTDHLAVRNLRHGSEGTAREGPSGAIASGPPKRKASRAGSARWIEHGKPFSATVPTENSVRAPQRAM